jgi:hypothetical protein
MILTRLVAWWQARCPHDPKYVSADVMEGEGAGVAVKWCRRCGAYACDYRTPMEQWAKGPKHMTRPNARWWR